jgi:hypothetical protein
MKIYWSAILTGWVSVLVSYAMFRVGETSGPTTYTIGLPFVMLFISLFPALLGYLIGREK